MTVMSIYSSLLALCRDFAFVASDKDTCMLKCHVFRCNAPAKTIASALHEMCSKVRSLLKLIFNIILLLNRLQSQCITAFIVIGLFPQIMAEKAALQPSMARSLTMQSISPEDLPRQGMTNAIFLRNWLLLNLNGWFTLLLYYFMRLDVFECFPVDFLEAVRQKVQKIEVEYIGNLPVSRAMGEWVLGHSDT